MRQEVASLRFGRYVACGSPGALAFRGNRCRRSTRKVCLAIPGRIVEVVDEPNRLAKVDVAGVRRNVNIGLLDDDDGGAGPATGS